MRTILNVKTTHLSIESVEFFSCCIYWIPYPVCQGGSGPRSLPSLSSECVVSQICIAAVNSLSHDLQFYGIYHRRFPPHSFLLRSGVPQGSILGSHICGGNAGPTKAVGCSRLSTVRSEWAGNEIWLLLLWHWQTTHPRLHIRDLRDRFTTKDFPLCHYCPHPGNYGSLVTQA